MLCCTSFDWDRLTEESTSAHGNGEVAFNRLIHGIERVLNNFVHASRQRVLSLLRVTDELFSTTFQPCSFPLGTYRPTSRHARSSRVNARHYE